MIGGARAAAIQTRPKAAGDLRDGTCPKLFNQSASQFLRPVADQERDHLGLVRLEFSAPSPIAVSRVREQYALRISRVPLVLGGAELPNGGFLSRWRNAVMKAHHLCKFGHGR